MRARKSTANKSSRPVVPTMIKFDRITKLLPFIAATLGLVFLAFCNFAIAQTTAIVTKNNPYSPSPTGKVKSNTPVPVPTQATASTSSVSREVAFVMQNQAATQRDEARPNIAQNSTKPARVFEISPSRPAVEIYKVGIGDVLAIKLVNSPQGAGYFSVLPDGTIDYPLAGENIVVANKTVDTIGKTIAAGITLFPDPKVEVKVREYLSHKVTVSGLVETTGERSIQRDAIPLFVIRADAVVSSKATKAVIRRNNPVKDETYYLRDSNTDNVLVYPGDSIEFAEGSEPVAEQNADFYSIIGDIVTPGRKEYSAQIRLSQALLASGGVKGSPKKAVIKRKDANGVVSIIEFNLRALKDGKAMDPIILSGDAVEIRN
ncbi:hypothetical protein BH10ACI2_BH10ACI2_23240 [soil metagenome]